MSLQWHHGEQYGSWWKNSSSWATLASSMLQVPCLRGGCGNYIIGLNEGNGLNLMKSEVGKCLRIKHAEVGKCMFDTDLFDWDFPGVQGSFRCIVWLRRLHCIELWRLCSRCGEICPWNRLEVIRKSQEDDWRGLESWDASYGFISGPDSTVNSSLVRKYSILIADGLIMVNLPPSNFHSNAFLQHGFRWLQQLRGHLRLCRLQPFRHGWLGFWPQWAPGMLNNCSCQSFEQFWWAIFFNCIMEMWGFPKIEVPQNGWWK